MEKTPPIPPNHGGPIPTPNPNDVLSGRGTRINAHPGNVKFRQMAESLKRDYQRPSTKRPEKTTIAQKLVGMVRNQDPPGRFLKEDDTAVKVKGDGDGKEEEGVCWLEIGDERAYKKASQVLREGNPDSCFYKSNGDLGHGGSAHTTKTSQPLTIRIAVGTQNPCKLLAVKKAFEDIFLRGDNINNEEEDTNVAKVRSGEVGEADTATVKVPRIKIVILPYSVPSGVSDQPFGDAETRMGAINRAKAASVSACSDATTCHAPHPDFAVGLEGGLEKEYQQPMSVKNDKQKQPPIPPPPKELWCTAWMAILGSNSTKCLAARAPESTYKVKKVNAITWGYAKTASFLLPPALCTLVLDKNMELGHADDLVFGRVNSKHGSGTVGKLTDGEIDRMEYYVHALKLALIPWIRPELYFV